MDHGVQGKIIAEGTGLISSAAWQKLTALAGLLRNKHDDSLWNPRPDDCEDTRQKRPPALLTQSTRPWIFILLSGR